jgi:hypothetical protein
MPYTTQELTLDLPEVTQDRTVNVLTLADPERGTPYQIIMNRDQLLAEETLPQCVARQLGVMTRQTQVFKLVSQQDSRIGTAQTPAVLLESHFTQAGQTYYQLQALLVTEAPKLLVITLSSHVPLSPTHRDMWLKTLQSMQPRWTEAPAA